MGQYQNILLVNIPAKPPRICRLGHTFDTFMTQTIQNGSTCSEKLRFQSLEQLQRLQVGFRFSKGIIRIKGYKFTSEEIILISLTRLHYPLSWNQVLLEFPGRKRWEAQIAFLWFLDFMIANWGYLILNNQKYWLPMFPTFAQAIRNKLTTLLREENRITYPNADDPAGGFPVALLIDNTITVINRVGGGLIKGGE